MLHRDLKRFAERPRRGSRLARLLSWLLAAAVLGLLAVWLLRPGERHAEAPAAATSSPAARPSDDASGYVTVPLRIPPPRQNAPPSDAADGPGDQTHLWRRHTIRAGDTLSGIFDQLGIPARTLHRVMASGDEAKQLTHIRPARQLSVRLAPDGRLLELRYAIDALHELRALDVGEEWVFEHVAHAVERRINHASGTIRSSFFLAARRAGLPDGMTMELAEIFGWDIDFALSIRESDQFTVLFEDLYRDGEAIGHGYIVAAEFVNQGKTYRAIRFEEPDGDIAYYTPDGESLRKSFLRSPVKFAHISSRFNLRRKHPLLNRIRAHRGVDYAARTGTPIRATGDGRIRYLGTKGGYGRTIVIGHANSYSTLYAHMSRYARGMKQGRRVEQGEIIGYVGMSGLATGPHLHYEFRVNGVHRDPLKVPLPKATPLPPAYRERFAAQAEPLLARLDVVKSVVLAAR